MNNINNDLKATFRELVESGKLELEPDYSKFESINWFLKELKRKLFIDTIPFRTYNSFIPYEDNFYFVYCKTDGSISYFEVNEENFKSVSTIVAKQYEIEQITRMIRNRQ